MQANRSKTYMFNECFDPIVCSVNNKCQMFKNRIIQLQELEFFLYDLCNDFVYQVFHKSSHTVEQFSLLEFFMKQRRRFHEANDDLFTFMMTAIVKLQNMYQNAKIKGLENYRAPNHQVLPTRNTTFNPVLENYRAPHQQVFPTSGTTFNPGLGIIQGQPGIIQFIPPTRPIFHHNPIQIQGLVSPGASIATIMQQCVPFTPYANDNGQRYPFQIQRSTQPNGIFINQWNTLNYQRNLNYPVNPVNAQDWNSITGRAGITIDGILPRNLCYSTPMSQRDSISAITGPTEYTQQLNRAQSVNNGTIHDNDPTTPPITQNHPIPPTNVPPNPSTLVIQVTRHGFPSPHQ